jgi:hypothetical protein
MKSPDELAVEIKSYKDDAEISIQKIAMRSTVAAIPFAGGAMLEIFDGLAQRRMQDRLNAVFDEMKNRLDQLGEEKIDQEFFRSEEFQTLLFLLLERLHTTQEKERLRVFGDALANSSSSDFRSDDKEQYVRVLRELSLSDLNVLRNKLLKGWTPHIADAVNYPADVMVSLARLQGMGLVLDRLSAESATVGALDLQMLMQNLVTQPPKKIFYLSVFGERFLKFISDASRN